MDGLKTLQYIKDVLPEPGDEGYHPWVERLRERVEQDLQEIQNKANSGIKVQLQTGPQFVLPFAWCNFEQLQAFYNKHPDRKFRMELGAKNENGLMGYPDRVYSIVDDRLEIDDYKIRVVLQPKGGPGLGKSWWFSPIADPNAWWLDVARPYYLTLYQSTSKPKEQAALIELTKMVKTAVEDGTFPYMEKQDE